MNRKITQTEFEQLSQRLKELYASLLQNSIEILFRGDKKEEEKFIEIAGTHIFYVRKGNILSIISSLVGLELIGLKKDNKLSALGDLTFNEWSSKIGQRLEEHCAANGYYKPNSISNLTSLKERFKKVKEILKNKVQLCQLLNYADKEDYDAIVDELIFLETIKEISSDSGEIYFVDDIFFEKLNFYFEDLIGRVEKLIGKKEQAERTNNSSSASSLFSDNHKSNLEAEIRRLQNQVSELENNIDNTTDNTQKETYQKMLDVTQKNLENKKKEKDKLNQSNTSYNGKLNFAIGLGVGAIIIGLICLILLVSRRKER
ncbi:MAG: Putative cysteine ligase BshC [Mycoplasmataceae bacterium]|nr:MAG: Putative cysteine ligase BshC [Mycoplasmataceae bacterium]